MMKLILSLLLFTFVGALYAQPDDAVSKIVNGKKYYVHTVVAGNTLYGIHKLYQTDLDLILNANPGLSNELIIGQQVLIPIEEEVASSNVHTVAAGETLYGISKKYDCSVSDLQKLNPGIEEGIQIGQAIKVPGKIATEVIQTDPVIQPKEYNISVSDSIVYHTVLDHETLYSISKRYMVSSDTIQSLNDMRGSKVKKGDILKIPIKKVNYQVLQKQITPIHKDSVIMTELGVKKGTYHIALLLPLMLAANEIEMNKSLLFGQVRELNPTTKIAFEFYQGFRMAVDSLKKAGLNIVLHVYDTQRDTATITQIFSGPEFNGMDLVVGPLYKNTIAHTVRLCVSQNIRIVLPFKSEPSVLHQNPKVYKSVSSNMTLMDGSVDYIVKNHAHHNVLILKPYDEGDLALYDRAVSRFNEQIVNVKSYNSAIVATGLGSSGGRELNAYMKSDTVNIVIVPSSDVKFVTNALNRLNKVLNMNPYAKKMKIVVFGFEDWNNFDDVDVLYRNRLHQHFSTFRFVDYNQGKGKEFVRAFRANTAVDPTVYSSQGFDIGMYFLSALYLHGTNFENQLGSHRLNLVQNDFDFRVISPGSGFENRNVKIVRYENFELIACP